MKKIIIIALCLIVTAGAVYFAFAGKDKTTANSPDNQDTTFDVSNSSEAVVASKDKETVIEANNGEESIVEDANKGNNGQSIANKEEKGEKRENDAELDDKSKESNENTLNNDKTSQNDDEFYDTADRDPFAEEQRESPTVWEDENGYIHSAGAGYYDEQGRASVMETTDIPDNLPPGAVFVTYIDEEEEQRLREEFGVGD